MNHDNDECAEPAQSHDPDHDERSRLDALFREEAPRLLSYFRRKTGNREVASDLLQESFLKLAGRGLAQLANPAAYLQRIARNVLFTSYRTSGDPRRPISVEIDELHGIPQRAEQEDGLAAQDLLRVYEHAISTLRPRTRAVFLLHRAQGLTYREIQVRMGMSMGNVEYHMMRAIDHVDRVLNPDG